MKEIFSKLATCPNQKNQMASKMLAAFTVSYCVLIDNNNGEQLETINNCYVKEGYIITATTELVYGCSVNRSFIRARKVLFSTIIRNG